MRRLVPAAAVLLAVAVLLRVGVLVVVAAALLLLSALSHLWMRSALGRLRVRRRFVDHAFLGEEVEVEVVVENGSGLPIPWLVARESVPMGEILPSVHREVVSLPPRGSVSLRYTVRCRRRGYHPIGPLRVEIGDPLGVVRLSALRSEVDRLIVYPRMVPLDRLDLPARAPLAWIPRPGALVEDPARLVGVRPYRPGDSPRRIHWPATAHTGELLVKQLEPGIARETLICLDLDREAYERGERTSASERAIVVAASVAHHALIREGLPVGLLTEAGDPLAGALVRFSLPPHPDRRHLMRILEVLARVQLAGGTSLAEMLGEESSRLPWGATLLAISGRLEPALVERLYVLRRSGFSVAAVVVGKTAPVLSSRGIGVHRVESEEGLRAWG